MVDRLAALKGALILTLNDTLSMRWIFRRFTVEGVVFRYSVGEGAVEKGREPIITLRQLNAAMLDASPSVFVTARDRDHRRRYIPCRRCAGAHRSHRAPETGGAGLATFAFPWLDMGPSPYVPSLRAQVVDAAHKFTLGLDPGG